jgi:hypothetical protein
MRKRVKTITEETHEYGTVVLENPLYSALLGLATADGVTTEHIDMWVDKTMSLSEDVDGDALTVSDHIVPITEGTPAALPAAVIAKTATP